MPPHISRASSPNPSQNVPETLDLVYDDQCPVCRAYCTRVRLDAPGATLNLVDARKGGVLMDEITKRGLDIDEGMVLKAGGKIFYGPEAVRELGRYGVPAGPLGWLHRVFFATPASARLFYPVGKALRNLVLRLKGIKKINNLGATDL